MIKEYKNYLNIYRIKYSLIFDLKLQNTTEKEKTNLEMGNQSSKLEINPR